MATHGIERTRISGATGVRTPCGPRDFQAGRELVEAYIAWVDRAAGVSLRDEQPSIDDELRDFERWYNPPAGALVLAELNGEQVGVAGVHLLGPDVAELKRVYVRPEARGHAFGERLVERVIEEARALGAREIWLTTLPAVMPHAIAIYESLGFHERPPFEGSPVPGLVAMELRLEA